MWIFKHNKMEESPADGGQGGTGGEQQSQGTQEQSGPNDNWQDDKSLDANGNPVEQTPQQGTQEPSNEDKNTGEQPKTKDFDFSTPVVKQIESLVAEAGLEPAEVAKAVTESDGQISPELVKKLAEKHGDAVASIIVDNLKTFHEANKAQAQSRDKAIFSQVEEAFKGVTEQNGQDTWKELSTWAKENVANEERKEINALLKEGGLKAKLAVDHLVNQFKSSNDFSQPAQLLEGTGGATEVGGMKPLSKADYQREFRALEAKGHIYGQSAELAALDKRREAGLRRGM